MAHPVRLQDERSPSVADSTDACLSEELDELTSRTEDEERVLEPIWMPMAVLDTATAKWAWCCGRGDWAWRFQGSSNETLVTSLHKCGHFTDDRVRQAMLSVDRVDFAPSTPYNDQPVPIGHGALINAPYMHAACLEVLKECLNEGDNALDVGSGSGYMTACMAMMVGETGRVVGIEHIHELKELSRTNVSKNHGDMLAKGRIVFVEGDGRLGYEPKAPYKAIHVGAAVSEPPQRLMHQLAKGGRMVIPVGTDWQRLVQVDKDRRGRVHFTDLMDTFSAPLTDRKSQIRKPL